MVKKTENNKCWKRYGETEASFFVNGNIKMVQSLWKIIRQFFKKLNKILP
jgi:hypothetical protein